MRNEFNFFFHDVETKNREGGGGWHVDGSTLGDAQNNDAITSFGFGVEMEVGGVQCAVRGHRGQETRPNELFVLSFDEEEREETSF